MNWSKKSQILNCAKIYSVEVTLFRVGEQTDRHNVANITFRNCFVYAPFLKYPICMLICATDGHLWYKFVVMCVTT